jgi:formate dehydrogenase subunit gamma
MTMQLTGSPAETSVRAICASFGDRPDELIEILHAVQHAQGFVSEAAVPEIAKALNLSRAEVHGVVTFYHDFRREPAGKHVIKMCRAEACQSMQGNELAAAAEKVLKIKFGQTTADRRVTLEKVYCLGLCACAPAMLVDGQPVGSVDAKAFRKIVAELSA